MNMKEIAQLAGVTAATVSNAINGTGNVSEKKSSIVIRDSRFVNEFHILKATCKFCTRLSTFVMTFPFFPLLL